VAHAAGPVPAPGASGCGVGPEYVHVTFDDLPDTAPRSVWRRVFLLFRSRRRGRGFWFGLAVDLLWPPLMLFTVPVWRGADRIPKTGPVLLASNHISFADPISETAFVLAQGRLPRYLAKAGLWKVPVIGRVLAGGGHIPVYRDTSEVANAYRDALAALDRGECVLVYPEGTFTHDPAHWPAKAKTGVARMALATGAPVIPMAVWGTHEVLPRGSSRPRLLPRKRVHTVVGEPVDLADLHGRDADRQAVREATDRIMAAITALLAGIREEEPPAAA
jgi:1-acyl-sn-glycerol-3-phosphate acyltransferase